MHCDSIQIANALKKSMEVFTIDTTFTKDYTEKKQNRSLPMANSKTLVQIQDPARTDGKVLVLSEQAYALGRTALKLYYDDSDIDLIMDDIHPDISVTKIVVTLH